MGQQNYTNHRQIVPVYHYFLLPLAFFSFVAACVEIILSLIKGKPGMVTFLILILTIISVLALILMRSFSLKAQDRAIRAEENLRHFVLTSKLLDPKLSIRQIIALRFAGDKEFPDLCEKAVTSNLTPDQIKKSIKDWKVDSYRV